jgi:hypothetical protein
MSTYKNCYALVSEVRQAIGEFSAAKVRGEDTLGGYHNDYIVTKINAAIRELYALIAKRVPDLFIEEVALVGVNSVYTLPWDFGSLIWFKNASGHQVFEIGQAERRLTDQTGSKRLYRRVGQTLVIDQANVTDTYTLTYMRKPRDIHHGLVVDGSAGSLTMDVKAPKVVDFFNGMTVEDETAGWVDVISDYTAAQVATIATETPVKLDAYGLVPEIPEWIHHLIGPRATLMVRQEHPLTKRKPTNQDIADYRDQLRSTLAEFTAPNKDVDYEKMFTAYEPSVGGIVLGGYRS